MATWIIVVIVVFVVISVLLLTIFLSFYKKRFQCDASALFFCYTDWICDQGTTNAAGTKIIKNEMTCHLKALYTALTDDSTTLDGKKTCASLGYVNRGAPCSSTVDAPPDDSNDGLCKGGSLVTAIPGSSGNADGGQDLSYCVCNMGSNSNSSTIAYAGQAAGVGGSCDPATGADCQGLGSNSCSGIFKFFNGLACTADPPS